MSRHVRAFALVGLWVVWCGASARAETLRCQSVNGNLNCAGSSGVSCQTVNGRRTCVSGHGGVVQSFGGGAPPDVSVDDGDERGEPGAAQAPEGRRGPGVPPRRDASGLHLQADGLSLDPD
nr:hypothetical protein [uncultured Rhodopila sp.]